MTRRLAEAVDWRYAMCPLETDAERLGPFRDLVALWQDRTGPDRLLPQRANFKMEDFKDWLGRIFIARVERSLQPPLYTVGHPTDGVVASRLHQ